MNHQQQNYLVLGAAGGIGSAVCRRLVEAGATVIGASRNLDRLAGRREITPVQCDASNWDQVEATIAAADPLNGIVNCSGSLLLKPAHLTTEAEWNATLTANLHSAFAAVRSGAKAMMGTGGSIVLVTSSAARVGLANHEAIAAAKAGVIGLALSAAATYAPRGVRVNCVSPGLVETPMTVRITGNEASRKISESMHALGRLGRPEEIASAIAWLLDPEQSWVTGQVLGVDGGLGSLRPR